MTDDRMTNLEIKFAHQEDFLEQLNKIVIDQQKKIESLEKEVTELKAGLNSSNESTAPDKPPHY